MRNSPLKLNHSLKKISDFTNKLIQHFKKIQTLNLVTTMYNIFFTRIDINLSNSIFWRLPKH